MNWTYDHSRKTFQRVTSPAARFWQSIAEALQVISPRVVANLLIFRLRH